MSETRADLAGRQAGSGFDALGDPFARFRYGRLTEAVLLVGLTVLSMAIFTPLQEYIALYNGKGWDGKYYFHAAEQWRDGTVGPIWPPYGHRVLHLYLAAHLPIDNLLFSFHVVNATASLIGAALLSAWLMTVTPYPIVRFLVAFIYAFSLFGPVRFTTFYPAAAGPVTFVVVASFVLAMHAYFKTGHVRWFLALCLLGAVAGATREWALLAFLALPFISYRPIIASWDVVLMPWRLAMALLRPLRDQRVAMLFLPFAIGLAVYMAIKVIIEARYHYSMPLHLVSVLSETNDMKVLLSLFGAMGLLPLLAVLNLTALRIWSRENPHLSAFLVIYLVFGWMNLGDERFFVWSIVGFSSVASYFVANTPTVRRDIVFWGVLFVASALLLRAHLPAPAYGVEYGDQPVWREILARFLPDAAHLYDVWLYMAPPKVLAGVLALVLTGGWVLWWRSTGRWIRRGDPR